MNVVERLWDGDVVKVVAESVGDELIEGTEGVRLKLTVSPRLAV